MKNLPIIVLAIGSLMFARGVPCASGYEYTVIDIGVLPQSVYSNAMAINDVGQVVGRSRVDIGFGLTAQRAFIWDAQNGIQNLGVLPGYTSSTANDINDYGQVVGWCQAGAGDERAFIWSFVDGMVDIGEGIAYGINNDGIVVGHTGYEGTAFSWDPNGQQTLELPLGFSISRAWGINDSGVIVGNVGDSRAVKWDPILGVLDLGVDGGAKCIKK